MTVVFIFRSYLYWFYTFQEYLFFNTLKQLPRLINYSSSHNISSNKRGFYLSHNWTISFIYLLTHIKLFVQDIKYTFGFLVFITTGGISLSCSVTTTLVFEHVEKTLCQTEINYVDFYGMRSLVCGVRVLVGEYLRKGINVTLCTCSFKIVETSIKF